MCRYFHRRNDAWPDSLRALLIAALVVGTSSVGTAYWPEDDDAVFSRYYAVWVALPGDAPLDELYRRINATNDYGLVAEDSLLRSLRQRYPDMGPLQVPLRSIGLELGPDLHNWVANRVVPTVGARIEKLREVVGQDDSHPIAWFDLSVELLKSGDIDSSVECLAASWDRPPHQWRHLSAFDEYFRERIGYAYVAEPRLKRLYAHLFRLYNIAIRETPVEDRSSLREGFRTHIRNLRETERLGSQQDDDGSRRGSDGGSRDEYDNTGQRKWEDLAEDDGDSGGPDDISRQPLGSEDIGDGGVEIEVDKLRRSMGLDAPMDGGGSEQLTVEVDSPVLYHALIPGGLVVRTYVNGVDETRSVATRPDTRNIDALGRGPQSYVALRSASSSGGPALHVLPNQELAGWAQVPRWHDAPPPLTIQPHQSVSGPDRMQYHIAIQIDSLRVDDGRFPLKLQGELDGATYTDGELTGIGVRNLRGRQEILNEPPGGWARTPTGLDVGRLRRVSEMRTGVNLDDSVYAANYVIPRWYGEPDAQISFVTYKPIPPCQECPDGTVREQPCLDPCPRRCRECPDGIERYEPCHPCPQRCPECWDRIVRYRPDCDDCPRCDVS